MRKQRRYTVRYTPTGAGKTIVRGIGVFHTIFGTIFFLIGLGALPYMLLFGLIFAAVGGLFTVNGTLIALGKNGLGRSYLIESEEEFGSEIPNIPPVEAHDHIPSTALDTKRRLEQLESLKSAGLIDDREYRQKREQILKEL